MKKNLIIAGAVFLFLILPLSAFQYYRFAINRPAQGFRETTFEISEGEEVSSISRRLYIESLVNSPFLFKLYLLVYERHTGIQAGVYNIPAGASIVQLGEIFQHGTNDIRITFVEGLRAEEIARQAANGFDNVDYDKLAKLAREKEGYLFPDTYFFSTDATEEEIVERLSQTFDIKTGELLTNENLSAAGLTRQEAVVFASIVEREVANPEDRPVVAGILIKRWKNGELIGADATTQYAVADFRVCGTLETDTTTCLTEVDAQNIDWWPRELSQEDLSLESVYNTRRVVGLPPTPISSPGLEAIDSVLHSQATPFNYYLTDADGITHYAVTLEEHNQNAARYL